MERKFAILKALKDDEASTWQIQRLANLSYLELHKLTAELMALEMLTREQRGLWGGANLGRTYARFFYSLTEKGRRAVHLFEQLETMFKPVEKPIIVPEY